MANPADYPLRLAIGSEDEIVLREGAGGDVFLSDGAAYRAKASTLQNQIAAAISLDVSAAITSSQSFIDLSNQVAANTAAIASNATQSSVVDIRPVGSSQSNSVAVYTDLWAANAADTRNSGDIITYTATHAILNTLPVANKTNVVLTITTTTASIAATSGTFASTDSGRLITATGIPANTFIDFVDSTHANLRDASGAAVTVGVVGGTGITSVISSTSHTWSLLFKINGGNFMQYDLVLPPAGSGTLYLCNFDLTFVQGADATHHVREAHWRISPAGSGGSGAPIVGTLLFDVSWASNDTATSVGTTRQSFEMRLTPSIACASAVINRHQSAMYSTRNP